MFDQNEDKVYNDVVELLNLRSDYGSADSISTLGIQYTHGSKNIKRDLKKAKECFQQALKINPDHLEANYYMGLIELIS